MFIELSTLKGPSSLYMLSPNSLSFLYHDHHLYPASISFLKTLRLCATHLLVFVLSKRTSTRFQRFKSYWKQSPNSSKNTYTGSWTMCGPYKIRHGQHRMPWCMDRAYPLVPHVPSSSHVCIAHGLCKIARELLGPWEIQSVDRVKCTVAWTALCMMCANLYATGPVFSWAWVGLFLTGWASGIT